MYERFSGSGKKVKEGDPGRLEKLLKMTETPSFDNEAEARILQLYQQEYNDDMVKFADVGHFGLDPSELDELKKYPDGFGDTFSNEDEEIENKRPRHGDVLEDLNELVENRSEEDKESFNLSGDEHVLDKRAIVGTLFP